MRYGPAHDFYIVARKNMDDKEGLPYPDGVVTSEENSRKFLKRFPVNDDLIQFIYRTTKFIKFKGPNKVKEGFGLFYYSISYVCGEELNKFYQLISAWVTMFELAPDPVPLLNEETGEKDGILFELRGLRDLLKEALEKDLMVVHFGI